MANIFLSPVFDERNLAGQKYLNLMIPSKKCTKCGEVKSIDQFHKDRRVKSGKSSRCKVCANSARKRNFEANRERDRVRKTEWYKANRDVLDVKSKMWAKRNPEKRKEVCAKWQKQNPHLVASGKARYLASKFKATPDWLSGEHHEEITDIYEKCAIITKETGICHHVDHIIPLNSPYVCGLHVPWNLRVIPAKDNLSKGNRDWEDLICAISY